MYPILILKGRFKMLKDILIMFIYIFIIAIIIMGIFASFCYGLFTNEKSFYLLTIALMSLLFYIMFNFHDLILHK